jgi:hypothetical protein
MTTTYWVELTCEVRPVKGDLDEHLLTLMDALMEEPGAVDADIAAELSTGKVVISMGVDAQTDRSALEKALLFARSAIHKAGAATPDWNMDPDTVEFEVIDGFDARVRPAELAH